MKIGKMYWNTRLACWYVKVNGHQKRLSPNEADANILHAQLVAKAGTVKNPTVHDLVAIYLGAKKNLAPSTIKKKRDILDKLTGMFGALDAAKLTAFQVQHDWIQTCYPNVGPTSTRDRLIEVQAIYAYATKRGLIRLNPLALIELPAAEQREHFVPFEDWPRLLENCKSEPLRDLVEFLLYTGARVQEAIRFTCEDFGGDRFTLPKARAKGRRQGRLVLIPEHMRGSMAARVKAVGSGPVFRNSAGRPWCKNSIGNAFWRLKSRMKDDELCATSLRHSFATWKVSIGVPIEVVAKLLGHTSLNMCYARYARYAKTRLLDDGVNAGCS